MNLVSLFAGPSVAGERFLSEVWAAFLLEFKANVGHKDTGAEAGELDFMLQVGLCEGVSLAAEVSMEYLAWFDWSAPAEPYSTFSLTPICGWLASLVAENKVVQAILLLSTLKVGLTICMFGDDACLHCQITRDSDIMTCRKRELHVGNSF